MCVPCPSPETPRAPCKTFWLKGWCYQRRAGAVAMASPLREPSLLCLPQPCHTKPLQGWEVEVPVPVSVFPLVHRTDLSGLLKMQPDYYPVWSNHTKSRHCSPYECCYLVMSNKAHEASRGCNAQITDPEQIPGRLPSTSMKPAARNYLGWIFIYLLSPLFSSEAGRLLLGAFNCFTPLLNLLK